MKAQIKERKGMPDSPADDRQCLFRSFCLAVSFVGDNSVIVVEIRLHADYISGSPPQDFSVPSIQAHHSIPDQVLNAEAYSFIANRIRE